MAVTSIGRRLIRVKVILENAGKKAVVNGILDTGAEGHAFVDRAVAARLGLPIGDRMSFTGIGGPVRYGFISSVDRLTIKENTDCHLAKVPVLVGDKGALSDVDVLVGLNSLMEMDMDIFLRRTGEVEFKCAGGEKVAVPLSPWTSQDVATAVGLLGLTVLGFIWFVTGGSHARA